MSKNKWLQVIVACTLVTVAAPVVFSQMTFEERRAWRSTAPLKELELEVDYVIVDDGEFEWIAITKHRCYPTQTSCNDDKVQCKLVGAGTTCTYCNGNSGTNNWCIQSPDNENCLTDNQSHRCGSVLTGTCALVGGIKTCTGGVVGGPCSFKSCFYTSG